MNDLAIRAGKIIREYRKAKGYSTNILAKELNVSVGFLNNVETGKSDSFNLTLLNNLCTTLDIPILQLITDNYDSINLTTTYINEQNKDLRNYFEPIFLSFSNLAFKLNYNHENLNIIIEKLLLELNYVENIIKTNK